MKRCYTSLFALFLLVSFGSGCATVLRGDKQMVKFATDPTPAAITVDGKEYTTPTEVKLKRKDPHLVTVSAEGYQAIQFQMIAQWDGASLPNIAAPGGSAMFATDTVTGADRSFYTLEVIKLVKTATPTTQPVMMFEHRGKIMTKDVYDKTIAEDRKYKEEVNDQ